MSSGSKKLNADQVAPEFHDFQNFSLALYTCRGTKKGKKGKNEDSCGFVSPTVNQVAMIVADGMGGHRMGDKASKMTVNAILGRSTQRRRPFKPAQMIEKVERAHQKIMDLKTDAGSTVVIAVVEGDGLWLYSVGDSLGLLFSDTGRIQYKTFEHSVTGFATESGLMEEKEAQAHEQSNEILNCLGFHDTRLEASMRLAYKPGETVLLCTDGLTEILTTDEVSSLLTAATFEEGIENLVARCRELRGNMQHFDDLSFVACRKK